MEKYHFPMDILKNKDDIALHIYNQDDLTNTSLIKYKDKYIQDTVYTLRFLSTSLEVGEPLIFINYMEWFGSLARHLNFNIDSMERYFKVCENVFQDIFDHSLSDSSIKTFKKGIESYRKSFLSTDLSEIDYDQFLNHLILMDSDLAHQHILKLVDQGMSLKDVYLKILQPTLYKVGELWQRRIITVAKEHYITAAIQHIIGRLYSILFSNREHNQKTITAVCAGDELHEIGMRMVADFFELSGWDSIFLGSNIPIDVIINHLIENPTQLFAISATTSSHLIEVRDLIKATKTNPNLKGIKIIVGGRVFNETPDLWKSLGADGYAMDAGQAVLLGTLLVDEAND